MALTDERDDRHAHHQRLACREAARIRERVERNVHVAILAQVIFRKAAHLNASEKLVRKAEPPQTLDRIRPPLPAVKDRMLQ